MHSKMEEAIFQKFHKTQEHVHMYKFKNITFKINMQQSCSLIKIFGADIIRILCTPHCTPMCKNIQIYDDQIYYFF